MKDKLDSLPKKIGSHLNLSSSNIFLIGILMAFYTPYGFLFLFTVFSLNFPYPYLPLSALYGGPFSSFGTMTKVELSIVPVCADLIMGILLVARRRKLYGRERAYGKYLILLTIANSVPLFVIYMVSFVCQFYAAPWVRNCGY